MPVSVVEFNLRPGSKISSRFLVVEKLGSGLEGEVYKVVELKTNCLRAIKIYYPHRNKNFKTSIITSQKLEKLNDSPIILNYYGHEIVSLKKMKVACIITEFIAGELLEDFVNKQKNKQLSIFPAIHLLHSLLKGLEFIHANREYHGDLHTENIIIKRFGLEFDIKIIDFHHWGDSKKDNQDEDIVKTIRIFYDILGGQKRYKKLPPSIKYIICGLKRNIILKRFRTISQLKTHFELMDWSDAV